MKNEGDDRREERRERRRERETEDRAVASNEQSVSLRKRKWNLWRTLRDTCIRYNTTNRICNVEKDECAFELLNKEEYLPFAKILGELRRSGDRCNQNVYRNVQKRSTSTTRDQELLKCPRKRKKKEKRVSEDKEETKKKKKKMRLSRNLKYARENQNSVSPPMLPKASHADRINHPPSSLSSPSLPSTPRIPERSRRKLPHVDPQVNAETFAERQRRQLEVSRWNIYDAFEAAHHQTARINPAFLFQQQFYRPYILRHVYDGGDMVAQSNAQRRFVVSQRRHTLYTSRVTNAASCAPQGLEAAEHRRRVIQRQTELLRAAMGD